MSEYTVYGLSLDGHDIRYVGVTTRGAAHRLDAHQKAARARYLYPLYHWMREVGPENVQTRVLCHAGTRDDLILAERWFIVELIDMGYCLLNVQKGGGGIRLPRKRRRRAKMYPHTATREEFNVAMETHLDKLRTEGRTQFLARDFEPVMAATSYSLGTVHKQLRILEKQGRIVDLGKVDSRGTTMWLMTEPCEYVDTA